MIRAIIILVMAAALWCRAQEEAPFQVRGDLQTDFQAYIKDNQSDTSSIPDTRTGSNSYLDFVISKDPFSAGARFESYQPALVGYDPRYKGLQLAHRYARYATDMVSVTVGNFYEQYGSGMILRSYWDWSMGYDNALDGVRVSAGPWHGVALKGLVGAQRLYGADGPGLVRGIDGEVRISDLLKLPESVPSVSVGGSFVSKYQKADHPTLNLPANVAAGAGRADISYGIAVLSAEYAHKINDPQQSNGYSYKDGDAALLTLSLASPGIGVSLGVRRTDNMDFRSDRGATGSDLMINSIQPLTPQHTYGLAAMYPYISQPNGEMAAQADIVCKVPQSFPMSALRGLRLWLNFSRAHEIVHDTVTNPHMGYASPVFKLNDTLLYQNANVELSKKIGRKINAILSFIVTQRNDAVLKLSEYHDMIYAYTAVLDMSYKIGDGHNVKADVEHLWTSQDRGNWVAGSVEYELRDFFLRLQDDYNYDNPDESKRYHYPSIGAGYTYNTMRVSLTYGRTRAGVVCAGGVCRIVPSVSGLSFSLSAGF